MRVDCAKLPRNSQRRQHNRTHMLLYYWCVVASIRYSLPWFAGPYNHPVIFHRSYRIERTVGLYPIMYYVVERSQNIYFSPSNFLPGQYGRQKYKFRAFGDSILWMRWRSLFMPRVLILSSRIAIGLWYHSQLIGIKKLHLGIFQNCTNLVLTKLNDQIG